MADMSLCSMAVQMCIRDRLTGTVCHQVHQFVTALHAVEQFIDGIQLHGSINLQFQVLLGHAAILRVQNGNDVAGCADHRIIYH